MVDCYGDNPSPEQLIKEPHKDVIISNASRWDGASIKQVRACFAEYLCKTKEEDYHYEARFAACLMIDERSLK